MNNFMQIITLQNPTFNGWVWFIGTAIIIIKAGFEYEEDQITAIKLAVFSWTWPIPAFFLIVLSPGYLLFWVGRKLRRQTHVANLSKGCRGGKD